MKYIIRSLKYLVYFFALFVVMVAIIWLLSPEKSQGLSVTSLFKEGAMPKLALFFVIVAAIYPALAFIKRKLYLSNSFAEDRNVIFGALENMGYKLESEEPGKTTFRLASATMRFSRMWEDRITIRTEENPVIVEGYRRDLDRVIRAISYAIAQASETSEEEGAAE